MCRWWMGRRRCRGGPSTRPTSCSPACWRGASTAAPMRTRKSSRSTHAGREGSRRAGHRHRCRLQQNLWRAADRPQRASPGARQGPLQGRAGSRRGSHRRGDRGQGPASHPHAGARAAGLLHGTRGNGGGCRPHPREEAWQPRTGGRLRAGRRSSGLRAGRSRVRGDLQLRRGVPEPDGDARRGGRLRCRARPANRARLHPGALLRASYALADPRHGYGEDPRHQAVRRRWLRLPHRMPQRRADRRAARPQSRWCRAHHAQSRGHLHHPPRPARDRHPHEDRPRQRPARSRAWSASASSAAGRIRATES